MKIAVLATAAQMEELGNIASIKNIIWLQKEEDFFIMNDANVYVNLFSDAAEKEYLFAGKAVIINSVVNTLTDINATADIIRINGWATFLQRNKWEVAGNITTEASAFFKMINKEIILVADEPGFVAARTVAMIINEAYFALQDEVSSKNEIDTAMKLGTNYPNGPFIWAAKIGIGNIYALLEKLHKNSSRYKPCELLKNEASA